MSEQKTVKIETTLDDLKGKPSINGGGQFFIGEDGFALVPLPVAAECYKHPNFRICNEADEAVVKEFLAKSIQTENGLYDAGDQVRVECKELAGVGTCAPDGVKVFFTPDGFSRCGINTAKALQQVIPSLSIEEPTPVAAPAPAPAASTPAASDDETDDDDSTDEGTDSDKTDESASAPKKRRGRKPKDVTASTESEDNPQ